MIKFLDDYIKIDGKNTTLLLREVSGKGKGKVEVLYYGKKVSDKSDFTCLGRDNRDMFGRASNDDRDFIPSVLNSTADNNNREAFAVINYKGMLFSRFVFTGAEMVDEISSPLPLARNKGGTVCLNYTDLVSGATLKQYFTTFEDSDVLASHAEIINTTDSEIFVQKLSSLCLGFIGDKMSVISYDGRWANERKRHENIIRGGRFEIDAKLGNSSAMHNPFCMAKFNDKVLGLNLIWSGNHKESFEITPYGRISIVTGMNDFAFNYKLAVGEKLTSPQAVFVIENSESEVTSQMHKFSHNHIVNPDFAYKERPILINNWEGTHFNFDEEKLLGMAEKASACGIELFVLDDGWFGKRDDDNSGLGDWFDNVKKTGGLKNLADKIKAYGMQFGLWVEPEMICEDSDLFRSNPEFAQIIPNVEPIRRRNQLFIDMANPKVCDYLVDRLTKVFSEVGVDYVKWDHNRSMSDIYSSALDNQGDYFYRYFVGQCSVLDRLVKAFPNVLFESCASGGSRYDLAMQYYMPQNWASDNTDAFDRLSIQEGTLAGYPQSSMGAHVNAHNYSIETRFNVAAFGAFGYEFDITKSTKSELATIKKQVAFYKKHRKLMQFGEYFRVGESLTTADTGTYMVVAPDKSEAMAVIVEKLRRREHNRPRFYFTGLDDNALYKVTSRKQSNVDLDFEFVAGGDLINNSPFDFEDIRYHETDRTKYLNAFATRMIYFKKIKK